MYTLAKTKTSMFMKWKIVVSNSMKFTNYRFIFAIQDHLMTVYHQHVITCPYNTPQG